MAYNILIVDDSQTMRKVIQKSITLSGFDVGECWEAGDGEEALKVIESKWIDLILTDFNMPRMNGFEMVKQIRKNEKYSHIPIILISTQSNEKVIQEGSALGIQGFIQKPFQPETIHDLLQRTMEKDHV